MSRQKKKGTAFESAVARYLRMKADDSTIDRMPLHGDADQGDITGLRYLGRDVVIECKDTRTLGLTEHLREAVREARNHEAAGHPTQCGVLVQHAPGVGIDSRPGDQWAILRLEDFTDLVLGAQAALDGARIEWSMDQRDKQEGQEE